MKKIAIILIALSFSLFTIHGAFGQNPLLELTFTAIDSASYIQLDSIKVMNRTQGCDTILYWPDSVLVLDYQVGISKINHGQESFHVFPNYPNPVIDKTTITLFVPEKAQVNLIITDMLGRKLINMGNVLERGYQSFRFTPGSRELYFFTALWKGNYSSIKILNTSLISKQVASLEFIGGENSKPKLKASEDVQSFSFSLEDELLFIGNTDTLQSGILDIPDTSKTYTFQYATNIPCPGTPTVTYEGQLYNTIQIFSQCWLKENLNVGTMLQGDQDMEDNGVIEKYCYDNNPFECETYGGLYQWDEMMQYTSTQRAQGICPPGWHIPTDEEVKVLEGAVDSHYGIGNTEWDGWDFRGYDVCHRLKSENGWTYNGNGNDLFGFNALPGGIRYSNHNFYHKGNHGYFWSANVDIGNYSWARLMYSPWPQVSRFSIYQDSGFSVRCIKDYQQ